MKASNLAFAVLWIAFSSIGVYAQAAPPADKQNSCKAFVKSFYAWYLQKEAEADTKRVRVTDLVLKERPEAFDKELSLRLKEDSEAQAKVKDDIVGLDFDPIHGGQDNCPPYDFRKVVTKGDSCWVEIFTPRCPPKSDKPDVVPELAERNGKWVFINFRYPRVSEDDLLTMLRKLREDRAKPASAPPR
jgi:hypothetical protein